MRTKIYVSAGACIMLAIMLLMLPLQWVFAAAAAACIHEFCHMIAIKLCGGDIASVALGSRGAQIRVFPMSAGKEFFCALAGPIGGLILLLFSKWIPRIAVCAVFHSLYNLLPIYPLDGGRALRCGSLLVLPMHSDLICMWSERICLTAITALSLYACFFLQLGVLPVLLAAMLWVKAKNTPCKWPDLRVQ